MSGLLPFPIEFLFFGLTLLGIALFHHQTLWIALGGMLIIVAYKLLFTDFDLVHHLAHEHNTLLNLLGLLTGFSLLAAHFEHSKLPLLLPDILPDDWKGGFVLIVLTAILSSFLDNIAAAMITGAIAMIVFQNRLHIGFLAAIVAASNAGGSGSVVGDTTTTMMWIEGVPASHVVKAFVGALPAVLICGYFGAKQQDKFQRILKDAPGDIKINYRKLLVVAMILAGAILTNVFFELPALGVWIAIGLGALITDTPWKELPPALKGSAFLLALVFSASMMPVDSLPPASWESAFSLGFISAVFDNIPLTKLALEQGGYDWGILAFTVGFGGSMIWFGSSAGVALTTRFPEGRSVVQWLKHGWHVIVAYVISFFIMLALTGWKP